jgi:molecular chaperone GrpE
MQLKNLEKLSSDLHDFLAKHNIKEIDPLGQPFDPNEHHAIGFAKAEEPSQANLVAETKRTCWKLKERVLR